MRIDQYKAFFDRPAWPSFGPSPGWYIQHTLKDSAHLLDQVSYYGPYTEGTAKYLARYANKNKSNFPTVQHKLLAKERVKP